LAVWCFFHHGAVLCMATSCLSWPEQWGFLPRGSLEQWGFLPRGSLEQWGVSPRGLIEVIMGSRPQRSLASITRLDLLAGGPVATLPLLVSSHLDVARSPRFEDTGEHLDRVPTLSREIAYVSGDGVNPLGPYALSEMKGEIGGRLEDSFEGNDGDEYLDACDQDLALGKLPVKHCHLASPSLCACWLCRSTRNRKATAINLPLRRRLRVWPYGINTSSAESRAHLALPDGLGVSCGPFAHGAGGLCRVSGVSYPTDLGGITAAPLLSGLDRDARYAGSGGSSAAAGCC
jgi:hypothetical protein